MRRLSAVPDELLALAAAQGGLVSSRNCDEHGVSSTRRTALVRNKVWQRLTTNVYDVCPEPARTKHPRERAVRAAWAAMLAYGDDAIPVGFSACALLASRACR